MNGSKPCNVCKFERTIITKVVHHGCTTFSFSSCGTITCLSVSLQFDNFQIVDFLSVNREAE